MSFKQVEFTMPRPVLAEYDAARSDAAQRAEILDIFLNAVRGACPESILEALITRLEVAR